MIGSSSLLLEKHTNWFHDGYTTLHSHQEHTDFPFPYPHQMDEDVVRLDDIHSDWNEMNFKVVLICISWWLRMLNIIKNTYWPFHFYFWGQSDHFNSRFVGWQSKFKSYLICKILYTLLSIISCEEQLAQTVSHPEAVCSGDFVLLPPPPHLCFKST